MAHLQHMNNLLTRGTRALRIGRFSCPGQVYFITSVCIGRYPIFADALVADLAHRCLLDARTWPDADCLGWVVMPDHIHALIRLGEKETLSLVVQRMKSLISTKINRQTGFSQTCWQRGFHDHALTANEPIYGFVQYIIENPLRSGLVLNIGDYPYLWFHKQFS